MAEKLTFVITSTDKEDNLNTVMKDVKSAYEKVINSRLPPTLDKILKGTMKEKDLKKKVNYAVSQIIKEFNYIGDWRTLEGQLIPKKFNELEKSKYGDCKDFSSALTAILRRSGVNASIAFVSRSPLNIKNSYKTNLFSPFSYNHVVVHIQDGKKEYWVDPVSPHANGLLINDDISLSESIIFSKSGIRLRKIPLSNSKDHHIHMEKTYDFKSLNNIQVSGNMKFTGRFSAELLASSKKESMEKIKEKIIDFISFGEKKNSVDMNPFDLDSMINRDLNFTFKYKTKKYHQV